jgi:hypothetical protein
MMPVHEFHCAACQITDLSANWDPTSDMQWQNCRRCGQPMVDLGWEAWLNSADPVAMLF